MKLNKINYHLKKSRKRSLLQKPKYVILFDLDETLGYFQDLKPLFDIKMFKNPNKSKKKIMFSLLDSNPSIFRNYLFSLLSFIKTKKRHNKNIKVALFTNNQGPKFWYSLIVEYINKRLNYELFDTIIGPYKIGNIQIEKQRTTHNKSIQDISNILNVPLDTTKFIMFDDQYHTNMTHKNVKYIHLYSYVPKNVDPLKYNEQIYKREYNMMKQQLKTFLPKYKPQINNHNTRKKVHKSKPNKIKNQKLIL